MTDYIKEYENWLNNPSLNEELKQELINIKDNEEEIKERFYKELSFGTAGLRGIIGAGTNRMNDYIIARATKAFGIVIKSHGEDFASRGVAIAYDSRIKSQEFAKISALMLNTLGIKVYLYDSLRATPQLSYAVRYYKCAAGINITASHNPKDYNGYKVYWEEGSQIKTDIADEILAEIAKLDLFELGDLILEKEAIDKGLLVIINEEVDESFYEKTMAISLRDNEVDKEISIVYTPLNGAGNIPVRTVLERMGYKNVSIVKEQEEADGTFPTVEYPNPEDVKAFEYANKLAREVNADIIIATDPDCDRVAAEVIHKGEIVPLNGNQAGVLMINYILSSMKEKGILPNNAAMVKSIVTGEMGEAIAESYKVKMFNVLTGFKNICALANDWDTTKEYTYIYGYEESIGYNIGSHLRDKDAVSATLILAEMVGYYKKLGKTLVDVLNELYEEYGYYSENTVSLVLEGMEGAKRITRMMQQYRDIYPRSIGNSKLVKFVDYDKLIEENILTGEKLAVNMENTDAIEYKFDDGCWYTLRPSGTEPKIKLYIYTKANTKEIADNKLNEIQEKVLEILNHIK